MVLKSWMELEGGSGEEGQGLVFEGVASILGRFWACIFDRLHKKFMACSSFFGVGGPAKTIQTKSSGFTFPGFGAGSASKINAGDRASERNP